VTLTDPVGSLSQLQIARAYAMAGDSANAEAAYGRFIRLWTTADRNLPVMKRVKNFSTMDAGAGS
jgi:hypothetical protein